MHDIGVIGLAVAGYLLAGVPIAEILMARLRRMPGSVVNRTDLPPFIHVLGYLMLVLIWPFYFVIFVMSFVSSFAGNRKHSDDE